MSIAQSQLIRDPYLTLPIKPDLNEKCQYCGVEFSFYNPLAWRRHHCRSCGSSCCSIHSYLKYLDNRESRKCIGIYELECERKRLNKLVEMVSDIK